MRTVLLPLTLLTACLWITPAQQAERMDLDADGVPRPTDCDDDDPDAGGPTRWFLDGEGDGAGRPGAGTEACTAPAGAVAADDDCDDGDAAVHPGADEVCDGADDDCDGTPDDGLEVPTWYADDDGDGHGDPARPITACQAPPDAVAEGDDCDDADPRAFPGATWHADADADGHGALAAEPSCLPPSPTHLPTGDDCDDLAGDVHPDADETCDGRDEDCDEDVDEDAVGAPVWYVDGDQDGFGDPTLPVAACARPAGATTTPQDCDDGDAAVHPLAPERCNGLDDDCDSATDDDDPMVVGRPAWYPDADADGFGQDAVPIWSCVAPAGHAPVPGDCDDADDAVSPGALEVCNGGDDDCDTLVDDDDPDRSAFGTAVWHVDTDRDGFGDPTIESAPSCAAPAGWVADATDCDDLDFLVHPGAIELCDGVDGDCNGGVDDGVQDVDWFLDADGDRWGAASTVRACARQPGSVPFPGDCDDADPLRHPDAAETCNGVDDDCDLATDDADPDVVAARWFADADLDGYGAGVGTPACAQPPGRSSRGDDCDDTTGLVHPGALELCGGRDEDCDGLLDDRDPDRVGAPAWAVDADGDTFGDATATVSACVPPADAVVDTRDCDDADPGVHPGAMEVCGGADDDCDGLVDDDDPTLDRGSATTWYLDLDGDGFGDLASTPTCAAPDAFVPDGGDCDPARPEVFPGAAELCDGLDNDCDGATDEALPTWYVDGDGDGHGDPARAVTQCAPPADGVLAGDDCDDGDADRFPGNPEVCDGDDDDCDGLVDDDDPGLTGTVWYPDRDADGFGDASAPWVACAAPAGFVADDTDCQDLLAQVFPGAPETCNLADDDCDGLVDADAPGVTDALALHPDADLDGYGDPAVVVVSCFLVPGTVTDGTDCDDRDFRVRPGGAEWCDGRDGDCDDLVDADDPDVLDAVVLYEDLDGDAFGDDVTGLASCDPIAGFTPWPGDCGVADPFTWPGAPEICDGVDNDCDGVVDDGAVATSWYADLDADGFGDASDAVVACEVQPDRVLDDTDCDDAEPLVNPAAAEECNLVDDDCDGRVDGDDPDLVGGTPYFRDADGDTFGDPSVTVDACGPPAGFVTRPRDCDDADPLVNPQADDVPGNTLDEDCSGRIACFRDGDGDGFGRPSVAVQDDGDGVCATADGEATVDTDCDDVDAAVSPAATEVCDGTVDDDCDGTVDDGCGGTGDTGSLPLCPGDPLPTGDFDGDGVGDRCDTCPLRADPTQDDADGDGIGDACDGALPGDDDGDGLSNGREAQQGTQRTVRDSDGDGVDDGVEVDILGTDPTLPDSDAGGATDGAEWAGGCDPLDGGDDGGC